MSALSLTALSGHAGFIYFIFHFVSVLGLTKGVIQKKELPFKPKAPGHVTHISLQHIFPLEQHSVGKPLSVNLAPCSTAAFDASFVQGKLKYSSYNWLNIIY